jgi:3',5'-cyclic AMP phosphodiesterase CpdA
MLACLFCLTEQRVLADSLKFVQLSDVHYSLDRKDTSYKLLSKSHPLLVDAVKKINFEKNIDFVMLTGDGIDQPIKNSLTALIDNLNGLKFPWYYALGNHDISSRAEVTKDVFLEVLKEKNSNFIFDSTYYTFKPKKDFRVIVIDGAKPEGYVSNAFISQEQFNWLDKTLSQSKKDVVLIFLHFPLFEPFDSEDHRIDNRKEFKAILEKYEMPIAIFTGHYHTTKIVKRGNILHVVTPSLVSYPNAFRTVSIDDKFRKVVFKFDFHETNLKELQKKAKIMAWGGKFYYGRPEDRETTVVIEK